MTCNLGMSEAVTPNLLDRIYNIAPVRRFLWQRWYALLTQRLRHDDVVFLNYAYEESPRMEIPLSAQDEPHRGCVQLYHRVALERSLENCSVLEVSCGHGGGASYLFRTFRPKMFVGLDRNQPGIELCRARHRFSGLSFVPGDAEQLPFTAETFDVLINVEASHCYGSFETFLEEAARVLKPGGSLLYADFRFAPDLPRWERALAAGPLTIKSQTDISRCVLRGMDLNSARSTSLVHRHLPKILHKVGNGFAGVKGSGIYNALERGELSYRVYHLMRPGQ